MLGPASSVSQALSLLAREPCHAGVLDINLGKETSEPIAEMLKEMGCPFLTVSSCNIDERPDAYADSQHLAKPIRSPSLVQELRTMLGA